MLYCPKIWALLRITKGRRNSMTVRINANSCKNALGTVFLLATVFFVCSTFISMRSVFADPIAPVNAGVTQSGRQSPRSNARTSNRTISRSTTSRGTAATRTPTRSAVSRAGGATRTISTRGITPTRGGTRTTQSRGVAARGQNGTTANRTVRARTATTNSRISTTGNVMSSGSRASVNTTYSYLNSRLYTGNYSNIIDSTTGLISAEAYSNCMESYYACMDEICTARASAKGRCSCAGRATNFLAAEEALERANEELITLSGQLSLLISTKGKGDDLAAAFSLTEAEQVMNCVSWQDAWATATNTTDSKGDSLSRQDVLYNWCKEHSLYDYTTNDCTFKISSKTGPDYCTSNKFGFDVNDLSDISGSSSDILSQLKAWAEAKDLAKQYGSNDDDLVSKYTTVAGVINGLSGIKYTVNTEKAELDSLANKWGYELYEYSHNNVCGRVLDSCFNGIYEACGTPPSIKESDGKTIHNKCANGATSSCPFNYNSYISVNKDTGDVELQERGTGNATSTSSASCFGYTNTTTTAATSRSTATSSTDPYFSLRGPVADARRSIMQKYLLDANAACDTYGESLKSTAQNINYQKVAAQQALQQKRLEFRQQESSETESNYTTYASNFVSCLDEIWECYEDYSDEEWTTARVKTYCAQKSQVPHCYETMVCSPSHIGLRAVIDKADIKDCTFAQDFRENTCRNVVTISEILYGTNSSKNTYEGYETLEYGTTNINSAYLRESCLQAADVDDIRLWEKGGERYACTMAQYKNTDPNATAGYNIKNKSSDKCEYLTKCTTGYMVNCVTNATTGDVECSCIVKETDCTANIFGATEAVRTLENGVWSNCTLKKCDEEHYTANFSTNKCEPRTINMCSQQQLSVANAVSGTQKWVPSNTTNASQGTWVCYVSQCHGTDVINDLGTACVAAPAEPETPAEPEE